MDEEQEKKISLSTQFLMESGSAFSRKFLDQQTNGCNLPGEWPAYFLELQDLPYNGFLVYILLLFSEWKPQTSTDKDILNAVKIIQANFV